MVKGRDALDEVFYALVEGEAVPDVMRFLPVHDGTLVVYDVHTNRL